MEISERAAEARIRRAAKRLKLQVVKSRWRLGSVDNYGGYQIVDPQLYCVLHGRRFDLSVDEVAHYLALYAHRRALLRLAADMNLLCGDCPNGCHMPNEQERAA